MQKLYVRIIVLILALTLTLPASAAPSDYGALIKQLPQSLKTAHFTVHSQGGSDAQWAASFLECLWTFVDRNFCPMSRSFQREVFLFPSKEVFLVHQKRAKEGTQSDFGYYDSTAKAFFTYPDSGYGTYAHEFMHSVADDCNLKLEPWAKEGIPSLFEKIYGYTNYSNPVFLMGYPNPWRVKALNRSLTTIDIQEVVLSRSWTDFSTEEQREVALFMFKEGRLKDYMELARNGNSGNFPTIFESAMHASLSDLTPKWKYHIELLQRKAAKIQEIPGSRYFGTKQEFDKFLGSDGLILQQFR